MSAGSDTVASTTALALSTPAGTSNSTYWLVSALRTPAPAAPVVTVDSNGACAGPATGVSPASSSGTVSGNSVAFGTTGTSTRVASGPVNTVTSGSLANIGTLSGSLVVTRSTSRCPARSLWAIMKHDGVMS